jgi:amino acid adenylation domain-containing protein
MLTDRQRDALTMRLRRGRRAGEGEIGRRDAGLTELPLSWGQEQLWFLDRFAPGMTAYNIPQALRLTGPLDQAALERALGGLIARHEALRTRLVPGPGGHPVQVIDPPATPSLELADLTGFEPGNWQERLAELIRADAMQPFDLAAGPLLRTWLARLGEGEHVLAFIAHHAVFDGWSAKVLARDLAALYRSEVTGEPCQLAELPVQFADYAVWERERLHGEVLAGLTEYWQKALAGAQTVQFPADRLRPVIDSFDGALATAMTDAGLLTGLRELSRRERVTLFAAVTAALLALLHRYTGQDDLVVGTVSANRSRGELEPLIGFLVNTLPIRCDVSGDPSFAELLARVKDTILDVFAHQELPFGKLVEVLGVARDASRAPVFQIALAFAERDDTPVPAAGVEFATSDLVAGIEAAKFDLTFTVQARPGGLWTECCYKTALFDAGTVDRLLGHWQTLLHGVVAQPSARLSQLPLLTAAELRAELAEWNHTDGHLPPGCAHELFEAQAARTPGAVAAIMADPGGDREQVSYGVLNERASQVARRLRGLGVSPEHLVGVCMGTGLPRLAALLGIWKAGGGYVPLDPALPAERLSFMIADAGLRIILTDRASRGSLRQAGEAGAARVLCLEDLADKEGRPRRPPAGDLAGTGVTPGNVAYVIYTSGSTGQPKGVVVEHRNLLNFVHGMIECWRLGPGSVVLQFASVAYDGSVMEMFLPLLAGGRVVLAPTDTLHSPPRLAELLRRERVTFALLTPAVLDLLPAGQYPDLRVLVTGGEELPAQLARRWTRPGPRLVNAYGPTEATVVASCAELEPGTPLPPPIGRPQPNCRTYVLDAHLNPVPAGVTGELHIGGAGVARGYLNRRELTAERFIADPFRPGGRLYKTGDLARRRPDGTLVFAGRIDGQVKIRGLRVELGEIEAALAAHPAVAQAVVTMVAGPAGGKQLAAYLRLRPGAAQPGGHGDRCGLASSLDKDVRSHLARVLPQAEIPDYLVAVSAFPLNNSGKIDRSALPPPASPGAASGGDAAPATLAEIMVCDVYAGVLGRDVVGATDSFFDLGGNSLAAMRLVGELSSELEVDVGVSAVFLAPAPRQLAAVLRDEHGLRDEPLQDVGPGDLGFPGSGESCGARAAPRP